MWGILVCVALKARGGCCGRKSFALTVTRRGNGGAALLEELATWFRGHSETVSCTVNTSAFTLEVTVRMRPSSTMSEDALSRQTSSGHVGILCGSKRRACPVSEGDKRRACPVREGDERRSCPESEGDETRDKGEKGERGWLVAMRKNTLDDRACNDDACESNSLNGQPTRGQYTVRVTMLQDSPSNFVVRGSIPVSCSLGMATHFSGVIAKLEAFVKGEV